MNQEQLAPEKIGEAAKRIAAFIHHTPTLTCSALNALTGAQLFFKCENFQRAGAFKFRGAVNAVLQLAEQDASRGVATHSSGNFAAALSLAARLRGIDAFVVMPKNAPAIKKEAVSAYGGKIVFCEPTLEARERSLAQVVEQTGAVFIHPFNNARVIAGQGTAALELLSEQERLDVLIAPVGGGGLISGTALAAGTAAYQIAVIGAEPAGADDACRSLAAGKIIPAVNPNTIADGLRTSLGELTFAVIQERVAEIITASDTEIIEAMKLICERMKIVIEPSSAVALAVVLKAPPAKFAGKRVGVILSGGNVDLDRLPWN